MNEIEKLDLVLRHMASKYPQSFPEKHGVISQQILDIHPELKIEGVDFTSEIFFILQKLVEDGYVRQDASGISADPWPYYAITFNGAYFIRHEDGYQGLVTRRNAESIRVETLASFQRAQAVRLNRLTLLAVLGTIALVLWEVLKYFVFEHHWYLYHS